MSEINKSEKIKQDIKIELEKLDLPWIFLTEIDKMFNHINHYKLFNLWNNKDYFFSYINDLSNQYEQDFLNILKNWNNDSYKS